MISTLDTYDFAEVFGEGSCTYNCPQLTPNRYILDTDTPITTFGREDVIFIKGIQDGDNDGPDWIVWGQLQDGRYFVARGGCDYTGWDCQASNSADVALDESVLIRYGMSKDERERFGMELPEDKQ